jgi:hypothetical protein
MTEEACNGMAFDRLHLMGHSNVLGDSRDLTETHCKQNQMQQHLEGRNLHPFPPTVPSAANCQRKRLTGTTIIHTVFQP